MYLKKDIAKAIGSLGNLCQNNRVNQVLILSLICRKNVHLNNLVSFLLTMIAFLLEIYERMVSTVFIEGHPH